MKHIRCDIFTLIIANCNFHGLVRGDRLLGLITSSVIRFLHACRGLLACVSACIYAMPASGYSTLISKGSTSWKLRVCSFGKRRRPGSRARVGIRSFLEDQPCTSPAGQPDLINLPHKMLKKKPQKVEYTFRDLF